MRLIWNLLNKETITSPSRLSYLCSPILVLWGEFSLKPLTASYSHYATTRIAFIMCTAYDTLEAMLPL